MEQPKLSGTAIKPRRRRAKTTGKSVPAANIQVATEYYSKAIGRALNVLEYFTDSETSLSLSEIARLSGFPESSLFRVLATLESHRYLQRRADGSYQLAAKVLFGIVHERAEGTRRAAHPFLEQLSRRFNETASLAFLYEDRIQVLDVIEALQDIRATNVLGKVLPPHSSSMAKAITAFQAKGRIDRILQVYGLPRLTEKTNVDRLAILAEYEHIREVGWAREREESAPGICCFGVPLFDEKRHVVAAVSLICPLIRLTPEREEEVIEALLKTSREASLALQTPAVGESRGEGPCPCP